MKTVGVNGFGRIGRYFTKIALQQEGINIALVNDLADINTLAHLFKYDSVHGVYPHKFTVVDNAFVFENGKKIIFSQEKDPSQIPWKQFNIDIVIESTGLFKTKELASAHIAAGAKKAIISAVPSNDVKTIVMGINQDLLDGSETVISNASCTTNNIAPLIAVMKTICEIENAFITTVHSYTADQRLHDAPHKDLRRARAATESIIPTTTGAAKAITRIFPEFEGKMGGGAVRVPVKDGSLSDITMSIKGSITIEEINTAMKKAAEGELKGILEYTEDPIVSIDILGNPASCIYDAGLTSIVGNMVKIVGWYDNEAGYSNRLVDLINYIKL
ncbi:MAG: type I glyceraldehyde-3-phosphate dehydrogenase [Crocinitomicaceae bacterium]|nr:type I glyceraldehyde-3-phosphate dehydrogenase [Crocinitomicaceae bacterium]